MTSKEYNYKLLNAVLKFLPDAISVGTTFAGLASRVGGKVIVVYNLRRMCFSLKTNLRDDLTLFALFTLLFFPTYEGKVDRLQHCREQ